MYNARQVDEDIMDSKPKLNVHYIISARHLLEVINRIIRNYLELY